MPDLTSAAATLRGSRFQFTGHIVTIPQTVVLTGTLSATPTFPTLTLAYTTVSGSHTNVTSGMTIRVLSGGVLKGVLRVATGGTISNVSLPVNEFSANTCNAASGDTIEVVKENRIWDKLVSATAAFLKDSRITYSDQLSDPPPVACSGGAYANFSDNITSGVNFYGSTSWVVDPDSNGTMSHAWSFPGATPNTSTDADPTGIVLAEGFTLASHTVTDSSNSKSTTQYVPVWICDRTGDDAPLSVVLESLSASVESGWTASFKLPIAAQADIDAMPDGALVVYWEEETYSGTKASYGSNVTGRGHIKFVGYLVRSTIHIDANNNDITFEAVSPLGKLELTPALPQLMINDSTPANWQEVKTLTIKRALWYLLYWGSTYTDIFDFVWVDGNDLAYTRLAIQETGSLAAQINDLMSSINAPVTCDRSGRLLVYEDGDFLSSAERTSRTKIYDFTTADIVEIDIPKEHVGTTKHVRGEAITTGGSPVFANAGNAPSSIGTASDTLSKQIVSNQTDINARTGYYFAKVNSLYDGRFVPRGATLVVRGAYDVFDPAYRDFLTITLADSTNKRGEAFTTSTRWTVERVDITPDAENGTKQVRLTLNHETTGAAGVKYIPPQASDSGYEFPPLDLQVPWLDLDTSLVGLNTSVNTLAVFASDGNLHLTSNFSNPESAGGPTWTTVDLTALTNWPGGSEVVAFEVDAYSPAYIYNESADSVDGWLCTDTHVVRITDIFGTVAFSATDVFAFRETSTKRTMRFERGQQGFGIVATWYDEDGVYAAVTTDSGANWTEAQVTADYQTATANEFMPGVHVDPHTANRAIVAAYNATGGQSGSPLAEATLYVTVNAGVAWAQMSAPGTPDSGVMATPTIAIAFQDRTTGAVYYRHAPGAVPTTLTTRRLTAAGDANISPVVDSKSYAPYPSPRSLAIPDNDANTLYMCGTDGAAARLNGVFVTHTAKMTTPTWTTLVTPSLTLVYQHVYALSRDTAILLGNGAIAFVDGEVVDSRIGDLVTSANLIGICGG